jgi:hypothetical protein
MTSKPSDVNAKAALAFGIAVPLLHTGRCLLWGHWWPLIAWPINIDAFVAGAILVAGALGRLRQRAWGGPLIVAGWGFAAGLAYRSLFEQLADPSRHGGHETLVMAVKAICLVGAALGIVDAARTAGARAG